MNTNEQEAGISYDNQQLTEYEKEEIAEFQNSNSVYYVATLHQKRSHEYYKTEGDEIFTDKVGNYRIVWNDHINFRYEILQIVGIGSYSIVIKAYDHKENREVAIKVFNNNFRREIFIEEIEKLLQLRNAYKNANSPFVLVYESFVFRKHLFVVMELLQQTLRESLTTARMDMITIKHIMKQLLQGLITLNLFGIVHSDLKPDNITYQSTDENRVKIIDFGLAGYITSKNPWFTGTTYYRSPENLFSICYGTETDMWALGCISVELLTGEILFPGNSKGEQLAFMVETLGQPPKDLYKKESISHFTNDPKKHAEKLKYITIFEKSIAKNMKFVMPGHRSLKKLMRNCDNAHFLDFVKQCLMWDPSERLTAQRALFHPWLCNPQALTETEHTNSSRSANPSTGLRVSSDNTTSRQTNACDYIEKALTQLQLY